MAFDTKGLVGKGLGLVGGVAGGAIGGPAGAMAGGALGGMAGNAIDAYAAQAAATEQATQGMFGGPRVRPIPAGARSSPTASLPAQAALSAGSQEPPGPQPRPANFLNRSAPLQE